MKQVRRLSQIRTILRDKGNASTKYLCSVLNVSESTVRRDIDYLTSEDSRITRVHGGVVLKNSHDSEYMFELKLELNLEYKRRIARKALEFVDDSESLIVDSGTTCLYAAKEFHQIQHLRAVALDIKAAEELAQHENVESIVVGGLIRSGYYTIGETLAVEMLNSFSVDKALLSADAVDVDHGVTNFSIFEVGIKKRAIEKAGQGILLADYTKFGHRSFYKVADLSQYSVIITNQELDNSTAKAIREKGIELVLA